MLAAKVAPVARNARAKKVCGRRYSTKAAPTKSQGLTFTTTQVKYSDMLKTKKARFGEHLHEFKAAHEAPIVEVYAQIRAEKQAAARKLRNRLASKEARLRRGDRRAEKAAIVAMDTREFKLQEQLHELLHEPDVTLGQFMVSGHPKVQALAEEMDIFENIHQPFDAFAEEAVHSDTWWPVGNLNSTFAPPRLKLAPSDRWHWEKSLPEDELRKIIAADILSSGLPLREDAKIIATGTDLLNEADFESQGIRLSPAPNPNGILKPLVPDWMPVDVSSPAVLLKSQIAVKRFRHTRRHVDFASEDTPFVLETDEFPALTEMTKRKSPLPTAQMQRKAKLRIHLPGLSLPAAVRQRLIALSGPRYDATEDIVTIVADSQQNRNLNISQVYKTAGNLLNEAWKADLNYVPIEDNLPPHEKVQREVELAAERQALLEALDVEAIKKPKSFTFFRVASYPQPAAIQKGCDSVKSILQELSS